MSNVIIYSSNSCGYCVLAKEYLQEKGVSYEEKNVSTDPAARKELIQKGYRGVPVIVVNGEEIVGFDKARLEELL